MYLGAETGQMNDPLFREEAEWVSTAWLVPWERARQARILNVALEGDHNPLELLWKRLAGPHSSTLETHREFPATPWQQGAGRAMRLKLALRWFQADNGRAAENLEELVPKYLPSIPLDPYDGEPFRYRLSRGEVIEWPSDPPDPNARAMPPMGGQPGAVPVAVQPPTRKIPAGQGVLWSVGEDKVDDGGHRQSRSSSGQTALGEDNVFLVPLPPKAK
jgi:hypothetical protein